MQARFARERPLLIWRGEAVEMQGEVSSDEDLPASNSDNDGEAMEEAQVDPRAVDGAVAEAESDKDSVFELMLAEARRVDRARQGDVAQREASSPARSPASQSSSSSSSSTSGSPSMAKRSTA